VYIAVVLIMEKDTMRECAVIVTTNNNLRM